MISISKKLHLTVSKQHSRSRGAALTEGVVAISLIISITIAAIFLLVSSGLAVYYKTKIGYAAQAGARFGTESAEWLGAPRPGVTDAQLEADVESVVNGALGLMGLPQATAGDIEVTRNTIAGKRFLTVTVTVRGLKIIGGNILPGIIDMKESAAQSFGNTKPPATLALTFVPTPPLAGGSMLIPVYGGFSTVSGNAPSPTLTPYTGSGTAAFQWNAGCDGSINPNPPLVP